MTQLISKNEPVTVKLTDPFSDAFNLMLENEFSQLPVIDEQFSPIGIVTYQSITRTLLYLETPLDELRVADVYEELNKSQIFRSDDELSDMLDRLRDSNAILINDAHEKLIGIVTTYDSTEYFRARSEDLLNVQDIETTVKDILMFMFQQQEDQPDNEKLRKAIEKVTNTNIVSKKDFSKALRGYMNVVGTDELNHEAMSQSFENNFEKIDEVKSFSDLTLYDYITLLLHKNQQSEFVKLFKHSPDRIRRLLNDVRNTRNDLAHLKEISPTQRDQLVRCKKLLDRIPLDSPIDTPEELQDSSVDVIQEKVVDNGIDSSRIIPTAEETQPRDSRYTPLADWLNGKSGSRDTVKLSFEQVEEIIGADLPNSAYKHRAWWANDSVTHNHSKLWLDVGWRRSYLNMSEQHVTFVRMKEREKAYIDFFNGLVAKLRDKADINFRDISPDGHSWITIQLIKSKANFSFSFSRGNRFRDELYIDTGEQTTTKKIFDLIRVHQEELEDKVGKITWERINDKRASRIALYHPGSITDDAETLSTLQDWAVDNMIAFYNAIEPIVSKAIAEVLSE